MSDLPPTQVNLDKLDLGSLTSAVLLLHGALTRVGCDVREYGGRAVPWTLEHWDDAVRQALDTERELTRLGLGPDLPPPHPPKGPRIVIGSAHRQDAISWLRDRLLATRGGTAEGWGRIPGPGWMPTHPTLPNLAPQLDELGRISDLLSRAVRDKPADLPRHSEDFRSVHWFGTDYTFSPTQAACVKILWKQWENRTPEIGQETILEHPEVEAESRRLVDVFKGHPAWRTMIVKGTTPGAYRLAEPSQKP